jgi:hypothetical protein
MTLRVPVGPTPEVATEVRSEARPVMERVSVHAMSSRPRPAVAVTRARAVCAAVRAARSMASA